jgi:hypothetical protein
VRSITVFCSAPRLPLLVAIRLFNVDNDEDGDDCISVRIEDDNGDDVIVLVNGGDDIEEIDNDDNDDDDGGKPRFGARLRIVVEEASTTGLPFILMAAPFVMLLLLSLLVRIADDD